MQPVQQPVQFCHAVFLPQYGAGLFRTSQPTAQLTRSLLLLASTACYTTSQGKTKVLDPDADDALGGTGTESGDIRTIAERYQNQYDAVMAALNLSHEVLALRDKVSTDGDQLARRIKSLREKVELALNHTNQLEL